MKNDEVTWLAMQKNVMGGQVSGIQVPVTSVFLKIQIGVRYYFNQ